MLKFALATAWVSASYRNYSVGEPDSDLLHKASCVYLSVYMYIDVGAFAFLPAWLTCLLSYAKLCVSFQNLMYT